MFLCDSPRHAKLCSWHSKRTNLRTVWNFSWTAPHSDPDQALHMLFDFEGRWWGKWEMRWGRLPAMRRGMKSWISSNGGKGGVRTGKGGGEGTQTGDMGKGTGGGGGHENASDGY